jgi:hypothetical protein
MSTELFYTALGKLLYAVAIADDSISKKEKETISKLISERLLQKEKETDRFATNDAWITQFSFETSEAMSLKEEEAFENFLVFTHEYRNELTEDELNLCLKLAEHLSESYRHVNNKENKLLTELRAHLMTLQASQLIF